MSDSFREFSLEGAADPARVRVAALIDLSIGVLAGILLWPFPVVRVALQQATGSAAAGWAVHVPLLIVFALDVACAYTAAANAWLGRTIGMYFQDLAPVGGPVRGARAVSLSIRWVAAGLAGLFGAAGPSRRLSEADVRSTKAVG